MKVVLLMTLTERWVVAVSLAPVVLQDVYKTLVVLRHLLGDVLGHGGKVTLLRLGGDD